MEFDEDLEGVPMMKLCFECLFDAAIPAKAAKSNSQKKTDDASSPVSSAAPKSGGGSVGSPGPTPSKTGPAKSGSSIPSAANSADSAKSKSYSLAEVDRKAENFERNLLGRVLAEHGGSGGGSPKPGTSTAAIRLHDGANPFRGTTAASSTGGAQFASESVAQQKAKGDLCSLDEESVGYSTAIANAANEENERKARSKGTNPFGGSGGSRHVNRRVKFILANGTKADSKSVGGGGAGHNLSDQIADAFLLSSAAGIGSRAPDDEQKPPATPMPSAGTEGKRPPGEILIRHDDTIGRSGKTSLSNISSIRLAAADRTYDAEREADALELETARQKKTSLLTRIAQHETEVNNAANECREKKLENAKNVTRMHEEAEAEYARAVSKSAKKMVRSAKKYEAKAASLTQSEDDGPLAATAQYLGDKFDDNDDSVSDFSDDASASIGRNLG